MSDSNADKVVPPSGFTAQLTIFVAAVMGFLSVFALALCMVSDRLADSWSAELANTSTIRITGDADTLTDNTNLVLYTQVTHLFAGKRRDGHRHALQILFAFLGGDNHLLQYSGGSLGCGQGGRYGGCQGQLLVSNSHYVFPVGLTITG